MKTHKNFLAVLSIGFVVVALFGIANKAMAASYNITVTSGPTVFGRNVNMSGTASATNYAGQFSQYGIAINWGDGSLTNYSSLSALGFTDNGTNFSGNWPNSTHTYALPGSYLAQVKLYRGSSGSPAQAVEYVPINIVCTPNFPPFEAPC